MKIKAWLAWRIINFIANSRRLGIYDFPAGLEKSEVRRVISRVATLVSQQLALKHSGKSAKMPDEIKIDPFLRFHANYSLTHVELNTPATSSLAEDLSSIINLREKSILCLGARNLDEIFQLRLNGADKKNITAIDLYTNIPEIIAMDFHDLRFPDNTFDVIFWAGSFAYSHTPQKAISEAMRVLNKNGGVLALGDSIGIGGATAASYRSGYANYINMLPELDQALNELSSEEVLMTQKFPDIESVEALFNDYDCDLILKRLYQFEGDGIASYNLIYRFMSRNN